MSLNLVGKLMVLASVVDPDLGVLKFLGLLDSDPSIVKQKIVRKTLFCDLS
jgi:hypothetical protein